MCLRACIALQPQWTCPLGCTEGTYNIKGSSKAGQHRHLLKIHSCVPSKVRTPRGSLQFELRKLLGKDLEKALNTLKQLDAHGKPTPYRIERKDKLKQRRELALAERREMQREEEEIVLVNSHRLRHLVCWRVSERKS